MLFPLFFKLEVMLNELIYFHYVFGLLQEVIFFGPFDLAIYFPINLFQLFGLLTENGIFLVGFLSFVEE